MDSLLKHLFDLMICQTQDLEDGGDDGGETHAPTPECNESMADPYSVLSDCDEPMPDTHSSLIEQEVREDLDKRFKVFPMHDQGEQDAPSVDPYMSKFVADDDDDCDLSIDDMQRMLAQTGDLEHASVNHPMCAKPKDAGLEEGN